MNLDLFNTPNEEVLARNSDPLLQGFQFINRRAAPLLLRYYANITKVEYYHSMIYQQYQRMMYKVIDGCLVIVKPSCIMGNYAIINYCTTNVAPDIREQLLDAGMAIRGADDQGKVEADGYEFVYDTDEFMAMDGSRFRKIRNRIREFVDNPDFTFTNGLNPDMYDVVENWVGLKGGKHQQKIYKVLREFADRLTITTHYYKGEVIGFSVVEPLNKRQGVIPQRLVNPAIIGLVKEPNLLLHFHDCRQHPGMMLNIGRARDKMINLAKEKLRPAEHRYIMRTPGRRKITKADYDLITLK